MPIVQTAGDIKRLKNSFQKLCRNRKEDKSRKQKQCATWNKKCSKRRQMRKEGKVEKHKEKKILMIWNSIQYSAHSCIFMKISVISFNFTSHSKFLVSRNLEKKTVIVTNGNKDCSGRGVLSYSNNFHFPMYNFLYMHSRILISCFLQSINRRSSHKSIFFQRNVHILVDFWYLDTIL